MKEYVLDTNAVVRYFRVGKGGGGEKVEDLFRLSDQRRIQLFMSVVNLGEVAYVLLKNAGAMTAEAYVKTLLQSVTLVDANQDGALEAARYKHRYRIGHADCFAASLALKRKATLVSADPAFEKFGPKLKWLRLPGFEQRKYTKVCPT